MHLFIISLYIPLHISSHIVLIIRRFYCIYTASGSLCITLIWFSLYIRKIYIFRYLLFVYAKTRHLICSYETFFYDNYVLLKFRIAEITRTIR